MPVTEELVACSVALGGGQPCGRVLYDAGTCIFHSTRVDKDCDLFEKELSVLLEAEPRVDCAGFIFPEKVRGLEGQVFPGDASFRQAIFLGAGAFVRAQFAGQADFTGAQFSRADFSEVEFTGAATFSRCRFMGDARFVGTRFHGTVTYHGAHFTGSTSFAQARVSGRADFSRSEFAAAAQFTGARFRAGVNFTATQFHHKVSFSRARFADEAYFSETRFPSVQECPSDTAVDMTEVSFERPDKVLFHLIDAARASFLKTHLRRVDFRDVRWGKRNNGREALWDELRPERVKDYAELARLYGQLRNNFEKEENHRAAADSRYGQMEMWRLRTGSGGAVSRFFQRQCSLLACYKWLSDYGENPKRAGMWMLGVVGGFAVLLSAGGFAAPAGLAESLQTSLAAFTFQAHSIASPLSRLGKWLVLVEGILGPVLILVWAMAAARSLR